MREEAQELIIQLDSLLHRKGLSADTKRLVWECMKTLMRFRDRAQEMENKVARVEALVSVFAYQPPRVH